MTGHTMFECCARCGRATIDVVDDECRTCGHQNRPLTRNQFCTVLAVAAVVVAAAVHALGVG